MLDAKAMNKPDFPIYCMNPEIQVSFVKTDLTDDGISVIVLSDGSRWIVRNKNSSVLEQIENQWKAKDDIRIDDCDDEKSDANFLLKNVRTKDVFLVDLDDELEAGSDPVTITKIDKNGYALLSSDGRHWSIGWLGSFSSSSWKIGDRLLINKGSFSDPADYTLIHLKDKEAVWASIIRW